MPSVHFASALIGSGQLPTDAMRRAMLEKACFILKP
jgi:hypothetical protein